LNQLSSDKDNVYILLELCSNHTLMELVKRRKRLTEPEVQYYMWQLVSTMDNLHSKNIIHRGPLVGHFSLSPFTLAFRGSILPLLSHANSH